MSVDTLTHRELVKTACLKYCIDKGYAIPQMEQLFQTAAASLRKEAVGGVISNAMSAGTNLGKLVAGMGVLGLAGSGVGSAALGYGAGRMAGNTAVGELPSSEDIQATDEVAMLERERDAVLQRILRNRRKKAESSKPSVRKIFN